MLLKFSTPWLPNSSEATHSLRYIGLKDRMQLPVSAGLVASRTSILIAVVFDLFHAFSARVGLASCLGTKYQVPFIMIHMFIKPMTLYASV